MTYSGLAATHFSHFCSYFINGGDRESFFLEIKRFTIRSELMTPQDLELDLFGFWA